MAQYGETEMVLLRLHTNLIEFYMKHNPANLNDDVLTILMQFFIDAGGAALNKKLMKKYGEDLQTFKKLDQSVPTINTGFDRTSRSMEQLKRTSLQKELGIDIQPAPITETNFSAETVRKSIETHHNVPSFDHRPKKTKKIKDPAYLAYVKNANQEADDLNNDIDDLLNEKPKNREPSEDKTLKLYLLDEPSDKKVSPRDLIEAFYAKHDEAKLDKEGEVDKFVNWVSNNSDKALDAKLRGKYGEGLFDMIKVARRRRNLEDLLTNFYMKYDRPKLESRWTILKILQWTIQHGVDELNAKFMTRYGFNVVNDPKKKKDDFDDLDI